MWNFGKSVKKWKNIEMAKKGKLENSGKTCLKVTKYEKLWSKVERCEKSGVKWENLVKVWKVETFGNIFKNIETAKKVKIENCGKTWLKEKNLKNPGGQ